MRAKVGLLRRELMVVSSTEKMRWMLWR